MAKINKEDAVQWYAQNRGLYKKLAEKVSVIISELLEESNITIHAISNRAKDVDSFKNKISNEKYNDPINQITDFSGIRVIAYVEDDLKPICDLIKNTFDIDEQNSGDKADDLGTDKVGYKSIHYIAQIKAERLTLPEYKKFKDLRFEIQVRTILQHAWAEIEHDRNYKFNGVLPPEIKRRFRLLAGTLELIDREFNQLSKDIDQIANSVDIANKSDNLSAVEINSTTLRSYLTSAFAEEIDLGYLDPTFADKDSQIIEELSKFGINTLEDLKTIIPNDVHKNIQETLDIFDAGTFLGLLRHLMMITDSEKYFAKAWDESWSYFDDDSLKFLKRYIDTDELIRKYHLQN